MPVSDEEWDICMAWCRTTTFSDQVCGMYCEEGWEEPDDE